MFKRFLFGKVVKISLAQLENSIADGGLKLTNLNRFNYSIKLSWVKRLINSNGEWQSLFETSFNIKSKQVFELDTKSLELLVRNVKNAFWSEILTHWLMYKSESKLNIDPRTYPIWNTFFITNENLKRQSRYLTRKGIVYVNDLYKPDGTLFGYNEFKQFYDIQINFVDFYGFFHCIPREWKLNYINKLKPEAIHQSVLRNLLNMKKVCRSVYTGLNQKSIFRRSHTEKWNDIIGEDLDQNTWSNYYCQNFICTIESQMRSFQYSILLRNIPTNKYLKRCKIVESELCYFCKTEIETIEHMFWFCPIINKLWHTLANKIEEICDIKLELNVKTVFLGTLQKQNNKMLNHIINIIKRYIFLVKCNQTVPNLKGVIALIKRNYNIEKNIVEFHNKNISILNDKWSPIMQLIL